MAQLYTKIDEDHSKFFKDNYVAQDGFYIKAKSPNFEGKVAVKKDQPNIQAKFQEKAVVADHPVDASLKLTSGGIHTLKGEWDINSVVEKTTLTHETNWNSSNNDHDTTVSVTNSSIQDMKLQFDFQYFKGGDWNLKNHFAKHFCSKLSFAGDFTWDGKKSEVNSTNLGFMWTPQEWSKIWITHSIQGTINGKTKFTNTGVLAWKQRFVASTSTILGFDFIYNLENKKTALVAGVETTPALGVLLRAKATSGGDVEASARVAANESWDVIVSAGAHVNEVTSKQQALIGVGIEGKLM